MGEKEPVSSVPEFQIGLFPYIELSHPQLALISRNRECGKVRISFSNLPILMDRNRFWYPCSLSNRHSAKIAIPGLGSFDIQLPLKLPNEETSSQILFDECTFTICQRTTNLHFNEQCNLEEGELVPEISVAVLKPENKEPLALFSLHGMRPDKYSNRCVYATEFWKKQS